MNKARLLLFLLLASFVSSTAQETVSLTFTANTQNGNFCPFDAVNVTNVTRGWTETLVYPDTLLIMTYTSVVENPGKAFCLSDAFPNPFTGETFAFLELPEKSDVALQVVRVDGSEVAVQRLCLDAGTYRLKVSLSSPNMAFLSVTTNYGRQVVKLVHTGHGTKDALDVDFVSAMTKSLDAASSLKLDVTGEFEPGDVMRYEAQLIDGGATIYSAPVTQSQYDDETITLVFALAMPTITTNGVTDITQTTATCGGNVADGGGLIVMARGVCWGTQHNPTVSGSHTSDGMGVGGFTSNMAGLTTGTMYHVRAYAVNRLGTSYGMEVNFTSQEEELTSDWVDLGLPSGLLWATRNVGASSPEDYGDYFAWAETQPKSVYSWSTYQYTCNNSLNGLTKYCNSSSYGCNGYTDNLANLQPCDDAATANWGGGARTPTREEWEELKNNCTSVWTTQNGVNGRLFTGPNGNCLFLPAAGHRDDSSLGCDGTHGVYRSSSLDTDFTYNAWGLAFRSGSCDMCYGFRCVGRSVRAVRSTSRD